jgi:hypothetical protein
VRARRDEVDAHRFGDRAHPLDEPGEIGDGIPGPVMRRTDDLDGVGQQLTGHVREGVGGAHFREQVRGGRGEFAATPIDTCDLPFDP